MKNTRASGEKKLNKKKTEISQFAKLPSKQRLKWTLISSKPKLYAELCKFDRIYHFLLIFIGFFILVAFNQMNLAFWMRFVFKNVKMW